VKRRHWFLFASVILLLGLGILVISNRHLGEFDPQASPAIFNNMPVAYQPQHLLALINSLESSRHVLGNSNEERWIEIDLSEQRLYAYEGNRLVYNFLISSGKWAPTPTGEFRVWAKVKYQRMTGGNKERHTFYDLPNVPFIQYFYKGYGLHGTYWHHNFGQPMSHGCINLSVTDAQTLYYWTSPTRNPDQNYVKVTIDDPGTRIIIHT
jgi:lipoprotein-anchoring transpeptidase ErfK/SrfK